MSGKDLSEILDEWESRNKKRRLVAAFLLGRILLIAFTTECHQQL